MFSDHLCPLLADLVQQIPYELKTYKRTKDKLAPPELKQVHPLGKSPVLTIETPNRSEPLVLAESAAMAEYLCRSKGDSPPDFAMLTIDEVIIMASILFPTDTPKAQMGRLVKRPRPGSVIGSLCTMPRAVSCH